MFFFEKKNQKSFLTVRLRGRPTLGAKKAKVFCFFFSKKKTFLPCLCPAPETAKTYQNLARTTTASRQARPNSSTNHPQIEWLTGRVPWHAAC